MSQLIPSPILIVCALFIEAEPWIQRFGLKQHPASKRIPYYRSEQCHLVVSGTGPVAAAVATVYLLQRLPAAVHENCQLFNIGLCGSPTQDLPKGRVVLGNCIHFSDSKRNFIPDTLVRHEFAECRLTTVSLPVTAVSKPSDASPLTVYEMEAAGVYQAAMPFLSPHQVHFLKIVSDHLEGEPLDKVAMRTLLEQNVEPIYGYMQASLKLPRTEPLRLSPEHSRWVDVLVEKLNLTATQKCQLTTAALACVAGGSEHLAVRCQPFLSRHPEDKHQRNAIFKQLLAGLVG